MRIVILGGCGFVGSRLSRYLSSRGHKVTTVDVNVNADYQVDLSHSFNWSSGDPVDCVINCCAGQYVSSDLPFFSRRRFFERANVETSRRLFEVFGSSEVHLINFGSSMMYELRGIATLNESSPLVPNGAYSQSKIDSHNILSGFKNYTLIVPPIISGPGRGGLFASVRAFAKFFGFIPWVVKAPVTSIVHVDDVVKFAGHCAERRLLGHFNVGCTQPESMDSWLEYMFEHAPNKLRVLRIPNIIWFLMGRMSFWRLIAREQALMLNADHKLDVSKAIDSGFAFERSVRDIISETIK